MTIMIYLHKLDIYITPWQLVRRLFKRTYFYQTQDGSGWRVKVYPEAKQTIYHVQLPLGDDRYIEVKDYEEKLRVNKSN